MQYFRIRLGFSFLDVTGDMPTFFLSRQKNFCFCTFYFFCLDNMHTVLLSEFCFGFLLSEFFFNTTEHIYSFIKYSVHFILIICHYLVNLEDWNLRKIKWQKKVDWCSALVKNYQQYMMLWYTYVNYLPHVKAKKVWYLEFIDTVWEY